MSYYFFKIAFRNLSRQRLYAALNIIGLAAGVACMLLAVLYWQDERSYNLFHEKAPQLWRITTLATERESGKRVPSGGTRQVHGPAFQAAIPEIKAMVRLLGGDIRGDVRHEDRALKLQMLFADDNFLDVFSFPLIQGDRHTALREINSAVISEETALKFFGSTDCLGKTLHLDADPSAERLGHKPMVVTGVAKSLSPRSSIQFDIAMPMRFMQLSFEDPGWIGGYLGTFVVLEKDAHLPQIAQKMGAVFAQQAQKEIQEAGFDPHLEFVLQNIADIHLNPLDGQENNWNEAGVVNGSSPLYSNLFLGIAFFVLLLACINFINISIATSLGRAREVGLRKLNGSKRRTVFAQFLGESILLNAAAFVLAGCLIPLILPAFNVLADKKIDLSDALDAQLIAGFGLVFLLNTLISGLYPAWQLSAFNPVETLYNRSRSARQSRLGKALVVLQFSLAFLFALATMVFYAQMRFIRQRDLGYEPGFVVRSNINGDRDYAPIKQFLQNEIARYPCFEGISFGGEFGNQTMDTEVSQGNKVRAVYQSADDHFLSVMHIPLRSGRNFTGPNSREVLVNETFVRAAGLKNPVGAAVKLHPDYADGEASYIIAGVVADFHVASLRQPIQPLALFQHSRHNGGIWLKIRRDQSEEALRRFEALYRQSMPGAVYEWQFLSDLNARAYVREQRWQSIVGAAAGLSLLICALGLFGLSQLNVQRRIKEIGIRKVLGASVAGISRLLAQDFLKLVLLAIVIASPFAYFVMQKWLANFAYRIDIQWWMFAAAAGMAISVALLTTGLQGLRAALADPARALRSE